MTEVSAERRRTMQAVRSVHTQPELIVRRLVYSLGFRYRLHRRDLPGKPDLVFSSRRQVVFVNGCFWHGHACARGSRAPKANAEYWQKKIQRNVERDAANQRRLEADNWRVLVIWECQLKDLNQVRSMLLKFLR